MQLFNSVAAAAEHIGLTADMEEFGFDHMKQRAADCGAVLTDEQIASVCAGSMDDNSDDGWRDILLAVAAGKNVEFQDDGGYTIDGEPSKFRD